MIIFVKILKKMMKILEQLKKGINHFKNKDYLKAETIFLSLVRRDPTNLNIYSYLIPVLIEQKKFKEALKFSERFFNLNKNNELGLIYIGIINYSLKKFSLALDFFEKSLLINPDNFDGLLNIGVTYRKLGNNKKAIKYFEKSKEINNNKSIVYYNLGSIYEEEGDLNKAILFFKKAISINKGDFDSIHALSLCQLSMQNYEEGLKNYEFRWLKKDFEKNYRNQHIPKLDSISSISERKILIWHEQGLGDTIQFSRYVNLLINLGAKVTFEVQKPLSSFLKRQFNCEITEDASKNNFDFQCPLMTLPSLFGMNLKNIPSINQYFICDSQKVELWKDILPLSRNKKNIGIAISGNVNQIYENRRKIDLEYFLPLTESYKFFVIQKNLYQNDQIILEKNNEIVYLGEKSQWANFEDTSAIVQNMDYIISIDTSLIHLACSMNKKAFLLLSKPADWRWSHEKFNSPNWYENITIIRQKSKNNWKDVMLELQKRLI